MDIQSVITGDIVKSRMLLADDREKLYIDLKNCLENFTKKEWIENYEVFRGDSFQCIIHPENSLRIALILRSFMKSYTSTTDKKRYFNNSEIKKSGTKGYFPGKQDIRLAIGIGKFDFIQKNSLAHSDGEMFHLAGDALDKLKNLPYRMTLKTFDTKFNEALEPSILLLDAIIQKWTNNQAETIFWKLQNKKEEEIATELGISQPAVNQRIKTSQWYAIEKLLSYFNNTVKTWE